MSGTTPSIQINKDTLRHWRHHARDLGKIRQSLKDLSGVEFTDEQIQGLLEQSNRKLRPTQVIATEDAILYIKPQTLEHITATVANIYEAHQALGTDKAVAVNYGDFEIIGISSADTGAAVYKGIQSFQNKNDAAFNIALTEVSKALNAYIQSPGLKAKITCNKPFSIQISEKLQQQLIAAIRLADSPAKTGAILAITQEGLTHQGRMDAKRAAEHKRPHPYSNFKSIMTWLDQVNRAHMANTESKPDSASPEAKV